MLPKDIVKACFQYPHIDLPCESQRMEYWCPIGITLEKPLAELGLLTTWSFVNYKSIDLFFTNHKHAYFYSFFAKIVIQKIFESFCLSCMVTSKQKTLFFDCFFVKFCKQRSFVTRNYWFAQFLPFRLCKPAPNLDLRKARIERH